MLARLTEEQVATLLKNAQTIPNYKLTVSLEEQTVTDDRGFKATFEVDPFRKFCLLEGLDDIGLTLAPRGGTGQVRSRTRRSRMAESEVKQLCQPQLSAFEIWHRPLSATRNQIAAPTN